MSQLSAWLTDQLGRRYESEVLGPRRAATLAAAQGRVLELGAGTGVSLPHYPAGPGIESVLLTEPDRHQRRRLTARATAQHRPTRVADARAERLPVDTGSIDTVVAMLVLCSVEDQSAALAEVRRVLRPDGRLLLLEHVRAADPRLARWQDRLAPLTRRLAGCRPNRDTVAAVADAGFDVAGLVPQTPRNRAERLQPLILGQAVPEPAHLHGPLSPAARPGLAGGRP